MARKRSRIYTRGGRYWGDFRAKGGRREPLVPPGERVATTDRDIAEVLAADRLKELEQASRSRVLLGIEGPAQLAEYATHYLVLRKKSSNVSERHIAALQTRLERAVDFFGADRDLDTIWVPEVGRYVEWLGKQPNGRGGRLGPSTVLHHLWALSNLYKRAISERRVPPNHNPIRAMMDKPSAKAEGEANFLTVPDAALLLESARRYAPRKGKAGAVPFMYPLLATYLLTGGRTQEVLGLEVADVSFKRSVVTFRPNDWRRLKTASAYRSVPLWPQLTDILQGYIFGGDAPMGEGLLFPSPSTRAMLRDFRRPLDAIAERAGWKAGEIRSRMFRHTYCSARLQTLDQGAPVSPYTVAKELGHGGDHLVKRIYGHLGQHRHRSEVVEYRVENHGDLIRERVAAL